MPAIWPLYHCPGLTACPEGVVTSAAAGGMGVMRLHLHHQLSPQQASGGGNEHSCQLGTRACHITPARRRCSGPYLPPGTVLCGQHATKSFIYSLNMFSEHLPNARHYARHWRATTKWAAQSLLESMWWGGEISKQETTTPPGRGRGMGEHRCCDELG